MRFCRVRTTHHLHEPRARRNPGPPACMGSASVFRLHWAVVTAIIGPVETRPWVGSATTSPRSQRKGCQMNLRGGNRERSTSRREFLQHRPALGRRSTPSRPPCRQNNDQVASLARGRGPARVNASSTQTRSSSRSRVSTTGCNESQSCSPYAEGGLPKDRSSSDGILQEGHRAIGGQRVLLGPRGPSPLHVEYGCQAATCSMGKAFGVEHRDSTGLKRAKAEKKNLDRRRLLSGLPLRGVRTHQDSSAPVLRAYRARRGLSNKRRARVRHQIPLSASSNAFIHLQITFDSGCCARSSGFGSRAAPDPRNDTLRSLTGGPTSRRHAPLRGGPSK